MGILFRASHRGNSFWQAGDVGRPRPSHFCLPDGLRRLGSYVVARTRPIQKPGFVVTHHPGAVNLRAVNALPWPSTNRKLRQRLLTLANLFWSPIRQSRNSLVSTRSLAARIGRFSENGLFPILLFIFFLSRTIFPSLFAHVSISSTESIPVQSDGAAFRGRTCSRLSSASSAFGTSSGSASPSFCLSRTRK